MPILLRAPEYRPGGPDGKGWNRLSLNAHMGTGSAQCALRPRSYQALFITRRNTYHARWADGYGSCIGNGDCNGCPLLVALEEQPKYLPANTDRVLVRLKERGSDGLPITPYVVDDPEAGWASPRYRWTWENLVRLAGWHIGRQHFDEYGEGFWLVKDDPNLLHGTKRED